MSRPRSVIIKIDKEKRDIDGGLVQVAVYGGMMRFHVNGSFGGFPVRNGERDGYRVTIHNDGSAEIDRLMLVPWDLSDCELTERMDEELNRMETLFGLGSGLSSSAYWAVSSDSGLDFLLTDAERSVIADI